MRKRDRQVLQDSGHRTESQLRACNLAAVLLLRAAVPAPAPAAAALAPAVAAEVVLRRLRETGRRRPGRRLTAGLTLVAMTCLRLAPRETLAALAAAGPTGGGGAVGDGAPLGADGGAVGELLTAMVGALGGPAKISTDAEAAIAQEDKWGGEGAKPVDRHLKKVR